MARSVKEWIGKTDDTAIPPRVKDRINRRANGRCERCGSPLAGQGVEIDHKVALILWTGDGHGNRESNLWALGKKCCHKKKTRMDVAQKALSAATRKAHSGFKARKGPPMPGSRASGWKRQYNREKGQWETVRR